MKVSHSITNSQTQPVRVWKVIIRMKARSESSASRSSCIRPTRVLIWASSPSKISKSTAQIPERISNNPERLRTNMWTKTMWFSKLRWNLNIVLTTSNHKSSNQDPAQDNQSRPEPVNSWKWIENRNNKSWYSRNMRTTSQKIKISWAMTTTNKFKSAYNKRNLNFRPDQTKVVVIGSKNRNWYRWRLSSTRYKTGKIMKMRIRPRSFLRTVIWRFHLKKRKMSGKRKKARVKEIWFSNTSKAKSVSAPASAMPQDGRSHRRQQNR